VKQAAEYLSHAEDCRRLLATARSETERVGLLQIAELWKALARHRQSERARPDT
jgi:hypothetical protein